VGGKQGLCPACNNAITIPRVTAARRQVEEVEGSASVVEPELIDEDHPRRSDRREEDEDRPQGSHLGMRREKLGSLAQAARSKHLRQLRGVLIFLAVLTIGVNVYLLVTVEDQVRNLINKDPNGARLPRGERQRVEAELVRLNTLFASLWIGLGTIYLLFACIVNWFPVPVAITSLVLFLGQQVTLAVLDPSNIPKGIFLKIIVIVCLAKGIQAAVAYQKERDEEARARDEAEAAYE